MINVRSTSYSTKMILVSIVAILFAVSMTITVSTRRLKLGLEEIHLEKMQSNSDFAALSIASPYVFYNRLLLDSFIDSFISNSYVDYAFIVDLSDNTILSHSAESSVGDSYNISPDTTLIRGTMNHGTLLIGETQYESISPIIIDNNIYGSLIVGYSKDIINSETSYIHYRIISIALMSVFLSIVVMIILGRVFSRPLTELSKHVSSISKGHIDREFPYYSGSGVVGELSKSIEKMVFEMEENFSMIKYNEEIYRAIFDSSNDVILIMDGFIIQEVNNRSIELFGFKPEEMTGCSLLDFTPQLQPHSVSSQSVLKDKMDLIDSHERLRFYFVLNRGDQLRWDAEISMSPTIINDKRLILTVIQDITVRKSSELEIAFLNKHLEQRVRERTNELELIQKDMRNLIDELETSNRKLEKVNRDKSIFLKTMSHEIKTPLNVVLGFLKLMSDMADLPDTMKSYIKIALSSSEGLISLIGDIMDINRLDDGDYTIFLEIFYFPDFIQEIMIPYYEEVIDRDIEFFLEIDKRLHSCIESDKELLKKILSSVIDNAVKFTNKGKISVIISLRSSGFIEFVVKDTGIGIAEEDLESIFKPFVQVDQSSTRSYGGTGLGITIAKSLCELLGGEISVSSEFRDGTTFTFTTPLVIKSCEKESCKGCDERDLIPDRSKSERKKCCNFLLAEDIEENARLLIIHIEKRGHTVDWVKNGMEAVRSISHSQYDCILMDINMPVMDGLDATKEIREMGCDTPIIALTAGLTSSEREMYYQIGMNEVIGKPIDFTLLWKKLNQICTYSDGSTSDKLEYIDVERGFDIWLSMEDYTQSLESFYHKYRGHVEILKELLDNRKIDDFHFIIHALKGVSGNLALKRLEEVTKEFDSYVKNREIEQLVNNSNILFYVMEKTLEHISELIDQRVDSNETPKEVSGTLNEIVPELCRLKEEFLYGDIDSELVSKVLSLLNGRVESSILNQLKESIELYNLNEAADIIEKILV